MGGLWPRCPTAETRSPSGWEGVGAPLAAQLEPYRPLTGLALAPWRCPTWLPGASSGQNPPRLSEYVCGYYETFDISGQVFRARRLKLTSPSSSIIGLLVERCCAPWRRWPRVSS